MATVTLKTCTQCRRGSHVLCAAQRCAHEGIACPKGKPRHRPGPTMVAPLPFHLAEPDPPTPPPSPPLRVPVVGETVGMHGTTPLVLVDGVPTLAGCTGCVADDLGRYPIGYCGSDCARRRRA